MKKLQEAIKGVKIKNEINNYNMLMRLVGDQDAYFQFDRAKKKGWISDAKKKFPMDKDKAIGYVLDLIDADDERTVNVLYDLMNAELSESMGIKNESGMHDKIYAAVDDMELADFMDTLIDAVDKKGRNMIDDAMEGDLAQRELGNLYRKAAVTILTRARKEIVKLGI